MLLPDGENSAVAGHAWTEHHRPAWDETSIIEQAKKNDMLRNKEALCIMMADQQKLLNRDQGTAIADCWGPLL